MRETQAGHMTFVQDAVRALEAEDLIGIPVLIKPVHHRPDGIFVIADAETDMTAVVLCFDDLVIVTDEDILIEEDRKSVV